VLSGDITVTFRLWRRPQVKAGGRYRIGPAHIEVDTIELVPFASINATDPDVVRSVVDRSATWIGRRVPGLRGMLGAHYRRPAESRRRP